MPSVPLSGVWRPEMKAALVKLQAEGVMAGAGEASILSQALFEVVACYVEEFGRMPMPDCLDVAFATAGDMVAESLAAHWRLEEARRSPQ